MGFKSATDARKAVSTISDWRKQNKPNAIGIRGHPQHYHPVSRIAGMDDNGVYTILACQYLQCDFEVKTSKRYEDVGVNLL